MYLVTRRGSWIMNRIADRGKPADLLMNVRARMLLGKFLSMNFLNWLIESKLQQRFDHSVYGLKPAHRVLGFEIFTKRLSPLLTFLLCCISLLNTFLSWYRYPLRRFLFNGVKFTEHFGTNTVKGREFELIFTFRSYYTTRLFPFSAHITMNDELPNRLACGTILIKPNIASFAKDAVVFEDGTTVDPVDEVCYFLWFFRREWEGKSCTHAWN